MTGKHPLDGIQGGFSRPEFSPGAALPGSQVRPEIAALDGTRAEHAELEEQQLQESLDANRRRRVHLFLVVSAAVIIVALIVFGMVWLWADARWALAGTAI